MTMLSPAATFHAELREQLGSVGRALSIQRGLLWVARGLTAGTVIVLGLVIWAWTRDGISALPIAGLVALPIVTGLLTGIATLFVRHRTPDLARRVDAAARLHERSTTALELGARGAEYPLALAQMRDAVEHLRRVDMLEAFPLKLPRRELMAAFFVSVVAAIVAISPNPWLLRARASNPAITIAREQAQRVQRLADSISPQDSAELESLRQLVSKGARTIDARSNEPDAALNALQDLEEQVQQLSAGDDQLAAALAAIASALASDPSTQNLSSAINTGDMREISQALKDLAQQTSTMDGQDAQRVAKVLRDASQRAGRVSSSVSGELADAADALSAGAGADASDSQMSDRGQQNGAAGQQGAGQSGATAQNGRSAQDALNQLSQNANAAGERQRAASQLESSRNALERALGRTQSRSGSNSSGRSSSSSSSRSQGQSAAGQDGDQAQGAGQGQAGDQGAGADGQNGGAPGNDQGEGGDTGQGGGFSQGGQNQNNTSASSGLDAVTTPQQVPGYGGVSPDESSTNPYASEAGDGTSRTSDEAVQPSFSRKPTSGNDSGSIPLGLRDLVKDYFSSLDQNQK